MSSLLVSRRARFLAAAVATGALVVGAGSPAMAADHSMQPAPSGSGECSPGLVDGTTAPMYAHFEKAHLERFDLGTNEKRSQQERKPLRISAP